MEDFRLGVHGVDAAQCVMQMVSRPEHVHVLIQLLDVVEDHVSWFPRRDDAVTAQVRWILIEYSVSFLIY